MIKEYAVDPELLNNWKDFRFFTTFFSLENGRAISGYPTPGEWKKFVKENLHKRKPLPMEKHKMVVALDKLTVIHSRDNSKWNDELGWLNNVIEEDKRKSFQAIILNENIKNIKHPKLILGNEVICSQLVPDSSSIKTLFNTSRSVIVNRKAQEMALCIKDLLQNSKQFIFIDPYFLAQPTDVDDPRSGERNKRIVKRHTRPLKEFLELISDNNKDNSLPVTRLQYHAKSDDRCVDDNTFISNSKKVLPSIIPKELIKLQLIRWENENLHNRYILTDIGGVMFGTGLDDNEEGNSESTDTDVVTLLDESTRSQLWRQFVSKAPLHEIQGTK